MTVFRHVAKGTFPGESWSFTLHTEGTIALTAAQAAWHSALGTFWTGSLDALVNENVSLTESSTASLSDSTGAQISRLSDDESLPGVATQGLLPPQCTVAVSLRTALATRAGRGRFYLPTFDKGTVTVSGGRLDSTSITATVTAAGDLLASLIADDLTPVIYSRSALTTQPITQYDVGDVIDTQRRRRDKLIEVRTGDSV